MQGASERMKHERSLVWWGAMMPNLKKPPKFEDFVGIERKARPKRDWQADLAAWESYAARRH